MIQETGKNGKKSLISIQIDEEYFVTRDDYNKLLEALDNALKNMASVVSSIHSSIDGKTNKLAEDMQKLDDKFANEITKKQRELDDKNNELFKKQEELKDASGQLSQNQTKLEYCNKELDKAKEDLEQNKQEKEKLEREIDSLKTSKQNLEKDIEDKNKELKEKQGELEVTQQELKKTTEEKEEFKQINIQMSEELSLSLYEEYRNLPQDFKGRFTQIKGDSLKGFVVTSGSKTSIIDLYNSIKTSLQGGNGSDSIIGFFDKLFEAYSAIYGLERLKESSEFNEDLHTRIHTTGRVPITKTHLLGFKDGKMTYKSIVE